MRLSIKKISITVTTLLIYTLSYSQSFYPSLYYHPLPYNAAYAGEDSLSLTLNAFCDKEFINGNDNSFDYRGTELTASKDFKSIHSGIGIIVHRNVAGRSGSEYHADLNMMGIMYNYKIQINDETHIRIGAEFNYHIYNVHQSGYELVHGDIIKADYDYHDNDFTVDPAVWYSYKNFNAGISMQNVFKTNKTAAFTNLIATYKLVDADKFKMAVAARYTRVKSGSYGYNEIQPEVDFEIFKAVVINGGLYNQWEGEGSNSRTFLGLGGRLSENSILMVNSYFHGDYGNGFYSAMLKCNF